MQANNLYRQGRVARVDVRKLPIISSQTIRAPARRAAEALFSKLPSQSNSGVDADEFPRLFTGGRLLPDLTQAEPLVISNDMQRRYAERENDLRDGAKLGVPVYVPKDEPPITIKTKEPSLYSRPRVRTVFIRPKAKRWGKR